MRRRTGPGAVIAAILLPPLGIFLTRGLGPEFWIGTALTLLFWVPGLVFALYTVLRPPVQNACLEMRERAHFEAAPGHTPTRPPI